MNRRTDPDGKNFEHMRDPKHYCIQHSVIHGNGEPGLVQDTQEIKRALYGDPKNGIKGMIEKQQDILVFMYSIRPFLNRKVLLVMFVLSFLACMKILGIGIIAQVAKALTGSWV